MQNSYPYHYSIILYVTDLNRQQNSFVWNGHLGKGFYFVTYAGEVKRGEEEVSVDDSSHVV